MPDGNGSNPNAQIEAMKAKLSELPNEKLVEGIIGLTTVLGKTIGQMTAISKALSTGVDRSSIIRKIAQLRIDTGNAHEEISDNMVIQQPKVTEQ